MPLHLALVFLAAFARAGDDVPPPPVPGVHCQDRDGTDFEWSDHADCARQINQKASEGAGLYQAMMAATSVGAANGDKTSQTLQAMLPAIAKSVQGFYEPKTDAWFNHVQTQSIQAPPGDKDPNAFVNDAQTRKQEIQQLKVNLDATRASVAQTGSTQLCKLGDCGTGRVMAQWMVDQNPADPQAHSNLAKNLFGLGDYSGAKNEASSAIGLNPNQEDALSLRSAAELKLGEEQAALADARSALGLDATDKLAGTVFHKLTDGAAGPLNRAVDKNDFMRFMWNKGDNTQAVGVEIGGSGGMVNGSALTMGERLSTEPWGQEALGKFQLGDYRAVIAMCDQLLAKDPNNVDALLLRANAKNMIGDYEGALADATKALELQPSSEAYDARAWALNHLGRNAEALKDADAALKINPKDAVAFLNRATANEGLGKAADALADYKKAAGINPAFKSAFESAYARLSKEGGEGGPTGLGSLLSGRKGAGLGLLVLLAALGAGVAALRSSGRRGAAGPRPTFSSTGSRGPARLATLGSDETGPGSVLAGKYAIESELGRGGMGVVFKGRDTMLERPIAVKKMRAELSASKGEKERFLQEARLVAALRHPGIVAIHDVFEEAGDLYLVFELVEGRPLDSIVESSRGLSLDECKRIMRQVCGALDYAHSRKIVHRDLKPSNIVVSPDGGVKVMDFGIARQAKDTIARMSATEGIGTPAYMPPEQELGKVCKESDIYALGATLYEMATGRPPFRTGNFTLQKREMQYTRPSALRAELSPQFDALMAKALQAEPEKRFRTAAEFQRALEAVPDSARAS
jgi:tetratricopeptide (TPR) repeat protein/tRNA A-37 threonylcarbamoyl transferase component Bud32